MIWHHHKFNTSMYVSAEELTKSNVKGRHGHAKKKVWLKIGSRGKLSARGPYTEGWSTRMLDYRVFCRRLVIISFDLSVVCTTMSGEVFKGKMTDSNAPQADFRSGCFHYVNDSHLVVVVTLNRVI
jgi:hypothetical protein